MSFIKDILEKLQLSSWKEGTLPRIVPEGTEKPTFPSRPQTGLSPCCLLGHLLVASHAILELCPLSHRDTWAAHPHSDVSNSSILVYFFLVSLYFKKYSYKQILNEVSYFTSTRQRQKDSGKTEREGGGQFEANLSYRSCLTKEGKGKKIKEGRGKRIDRGRGRKGRAEVGRGFFWGTGERGKDRINGENAWPAFYPPLSLAPVSILKL